MRKFEKVSLNEYLKYQTEESYNEIVLPKRQTEKSAGYDFYLPYDVLFEHKMDFGVLGMLTKQGGYDKLYIV